jgi:hypothetical protein
MLFWASNLEDKKCQDWDGNWWASAGLQRDDTLLSHYFYINEQILLKSEEGVVMKFNDPFGRMEKRHNAGYQTMREGLLRGGIDSPQAARELITKSRKSGLKIFAVAFLIVLLVSAIFPKIFFTALFFLILFGIWLTISAVNGQRYIERYIREELG